MEFNYEAQQDDELSLTVGDIIVNIRQDDGGWWEGELAGRRGLFPDNFVRVSRPRRGAAARGPVPDSATSRWGGVKWRRARRAARQDTLQSGSVLTGCFHSQGRVDVSVSHWAGWRGGLKSFLPQFNLFSCPC